MNKIKLRKTLKNQRKIHLFYGLSIPPIFIKFSITKVENFSHNVKPVEVDLYQKRSKFIFFSKMKKRGSLSTRDGKSSRTL